MFGSMRNTRENGDMDGPPVQLPDTGCPPDAPSSPSMPWDLRVQSFVGCFLLSIIASFCGSYLLVLTKLTGFCVMTSVSAVLSLASTCFLMGPIGQVKKMFVQSRWIASTLYIFFIFATLFAGLSLKSAPLAIICTVAQYAAMTWYSLSYIPYAREAASKILCSCC